MTLDSLSAVMDTASDAVFVLSEDGQYLHVNAAAEALLGYSLDEIRVRHITDLIATDAVSLGKGVALTRREGFWCGPVLYRHRNGGLVWTTVSVFTHQLADGTRVLVTTAYATARGAARPGVSASTGAFNLATEDVRLLQLLAHDFSDGQIAALLHTTETAVQQQVDALLPRIGAVSRTEALVKAMKERYIV